MRSFSYVFASFPVASGVASVIIGMRNNRILFATVYALEIVSFLVVGIKVFIRVSQRSKSD